MARQQQGRGRARFREDQLAQTPDWLTWNNRLDWTEQNKNNCTIFRPRILNGCAVSPGKFQIAKWTKWTPWTRQTQTKSAKAWVWSGELRRKWKVAMLECIQLFYTQDCPGPARLGVFLAWLFDTWQPDGSYPLWAVVGSEDATRGAEKDEAKRRAPGSSA